MRCLAGAMDRMKPKISGAWMSVITLFDGVVCKLFEGGNTLFSDLVVQDDRGEWLLSGLKRPQHYPNL